MNRKEEKTVRVSIIGFGMMSTPASVALKSMNLYFPKAPYLVKQAYALVRNEAEAERAKAAGWIAVYEMDTVIENSDVIYVANPNRFHKAPTLAALKAGKHVYCEKPLSCDADSSYEMLCAAKEKPRLFAGVNFIYRRSPALAYARWLVGTGVLGPICRADGVYIQSWGAKSLNAPYSWRFDPEHGGGASFDLASHALDALYAVTGKRPTTISAQTATHVKERFDEETKTWRKVLVDDTMEATYDLPGGGVGACSVSRNCWGGENQHRFEYYFENGSIKWSYDQFSDLEVYLANGAKLPNGDVLSRGWTRVDCNRAGFYGNQFADGHRLSYTSLTCNAWYENCIAIDALEREAEYESPMPYATFNDAYEVQRALVAALLSAKEGRRINVADVKATGEK